MSGPALRRNRFVVVVFQPAQVRAYAAFHLQRAKNDKIDAALIASCTAAVKKIHAPPDPRLEPFADHLTMIDRSARISPGSRPAANPAAIRASANSGRRRSPASSRLRGGVPLEYAAHCALRTADPCRKATQSCAHRPEARAARRCCRHAGCVRDLASHADHIGPETTLARADAQSRTAAWPIASTKPRRRSGRRSPLSQRKADVICSV